MIKKFIESEKSYINTTHPDFLGPEQSVLNLFDERTNITENQNQNNPQITRNFPINTFQGGLSVGNQSLNLNINSNFSNVKQNFKKDEEKKEKEEPIINLPNHMRPGFPTSRDVMETCIIKNLISSYYNVVKKNVSDIVPKTIMCMLVNESKLQAKNEMINQIYKSSELEVLLQEDPYVARKRKSTKETLSNLQQSLEVLSEIKDLKIV